MTKDAKEEIRDAVARRRARFDDSELVQINKIRFLIDELPSPEARQRCVRYLVDRYDSSRLKGATAGRGVGALIPGEMTFE